MLQSNFPSGTGPPRQANPIPAPFAAPLAAPVTRLSGSEPVAPGSAATTSLSLIFAGVVPCITANLPLSSTLARGPAGPEVDQPSTRNATNTQLAVVRPSFLLTVASMHMAHPLSCRVSRWSDRNEASIRTVQRLGRGDGQFNRGRREQRRRGLHGNFRVRNCTAGPNSASFRYVCPLFPGSRSRYPPGCTPVRRMIEGYWR